MAMTMKDFLLEQTKELTFLSLDIRELFKDKNIDFDKEAVEIPVLLEDLSSKLQKNDEEFVITTEILVKGITYLLGVDPNFKYREEYIRILESLSPDILKALLILGNKTFDQGEKIKGMIFLKGATTVNSKDSKALFNYAVALLTVAEDLRNEENPHDFKASQERIGIFQEEARFQLEKLIDLEPEHALAFYHLGFLYKKDSLFQKAEIFWEKALEFGLEEHLEEHVYTLLREIEDLVKYERGYQKVLQGDLASGLKELIELEERYPEWWNLQFFIGLAYRQQEQYSKAITYFQRVIELEERIPDPYVEIALSFAGLGKYHKAIEYFEKALEKDPNSGEILSNLAMVNLETGDLKNAEKYIEASLKVNPDDEITLACKEKLDLLKQNLGEK
ncbi:tetratricopeptide repeat protein [Isachenkonia alkalipeptolytica]|nr:tetratricopeptide repeat protein [Isachenkonia alkalipeptolytica]